MSLEQIHLLSQSKGKQATFKSIEKARCDLECAESYSPLQSIQNSEQAENGFQLCLHASAPQVVRWGLG